MTQRRCRYCEQDFQPSKYQPAQLVCSQPGCQRQRRADYHRQKVSADPEYRQVCRDSPQKWRSRNPDYWRRYREEHPEARSATVNDSMFGIKSAAFAILQTTTQLST